jgi:hypothetical protein
MISEHEADTWLRTEGGYKYHCFISWPRTQSSDITECARTLHSAIQERLASIFPDPKVFLDEAEIVVGDDWGRRLSTELCRSICMVAICAPIYYHPRHRWCGLEWAAMEALSDRRLAGEDYKAIIPIMVRKSDSLPRALSRIQHIDCSQITLKGRKYYKYMDFRAKVEQVVQRVREVALEVGRRRIIAGCEHFRFPEESAFADYAAEPQTYPLIG